MNETQFNRFPRIGVTRCIGLIALLGVVAGIASIFALRHGFPITASSWGGWECSVSLLQNGRYEYFGGSPCGPYSPLFSLYLAGFQIIFGISGKTVSYAMAAIALLNFWSWSMYVLFLQREFGLDVKVCQPSTVLSLLLLFFLIVTEMISPYHNMLLLMLIPISIILSYKLIELRSMTELVFYAGLNMALLVVMCLAHYSAYVYIIPSFAILIFNNRLSIPSRFITALVAMITTVLVCRIFTNPWIKSAGNMGLLDVYNGIGSGRYSPTEYLGQVIENFGHFWFPQDYAYYGGLFIIAFSVIFIIARNNKHIFGLVVRYPRSLYSVLYAAVSLCTIFVIYNVTTLDESLSLRFTWYAVFVMIPIIFALIPYHKKFATALVVSFFFATPLMRFSKYIIFGIMPEQPLSGKYRSNAILPEFYISATDGLSVPKISGSERVNPPNYIWIKRPLPFSRDGIDLIIK